MLERLMMVTFEPVGYAVLGLGWFAQCATLPAFRHSKKAKLVAVVSGDKSKARRLAKKFSASNAYTYEELPACFENRQVEAVYIATNNSSHARYAIEAANARRHVLCEKPMASSVDECSLMLEACRASGVRLMVAYRKYFDPAGLELKRMIGSGKLGRLKYIHTAFSLVCRPQGRARTWRLDGTVEGGGPLADLGVYEVSTIRWLLGQEPLEASAYRWTTDSETFRKVEENIAFRLTFPEGIVVQATVSFGAAHASFLQVHGERGWAAWNPAFQWNKKRRLFGEIDGQPFDKKFPVIDELARELDAFADAIRRQREPEPSGVQGMRDVAILAAIEQSAREGRVIPISLSE
jgi:predicted dehydrogenase